MKKKLIIILLMGFIIIGLTGCVTSNESNDSNTKNDNDNTKQQEKKEEKDDSIKEVIKKGYLCTYKLASMTKTLGVELENGKVTKFFNTLTYDGDLKMWCEEVHRRYDKLDEVKGATQSIICDESSNTTKVELTWILSEMKGFDDLYGDQIPEQIQFLNRENNEFYSKMFLEAMNTQHYTCVEK